MYSGGACGSFCGQKRFPPLTVGFPPVLSGKRFLLYAVCIVQKTQGIVRNVKIVYRQSVC